MPRVHTRTRRQYVIKYPMTCRVCGEEIRVGQTYRMWEKRMGGKQYMHASHGYPRPSWLSNRKTAVIEDALQDADFSTWSPEIGDYDVSDLKSILDGIADEADQVADEYEESADNMPESLQQGMQAEAMRDVADRLRDWASNMRDWEPSETEPEFDEDADEQAKQDIHDQWVEATRESAEETTGDMPEYEG